jgi:hypothetical protein
MKKGLCVATIWHRWTAVFPALPLPRLLPKQGGQATSPEVPSLLPLGDIDLDKAPTGVIAETGPNLGTKLFAMRSPPEAPSGRARARRATLPWPAKPPRTSTCTWRRTASLPRAPSARRWRPPPAPRCAITDWPARRRRGPRARTPPAVGAGVGWRDGRGRTRMACCGRALDLRRVELAVRSRARPAWARRVLGYSLPRGPGADDGNHPVESGRRGHAQADRPRLRQLPARKNFSMLAAQRWLLTEGPTRSGAPAGRRAGRRAGASAALAKGMGNSGDGKIMRERS